MVMVIDSYRDIAGRELAAVLRLRVNGRPVEGKDRAMASSGQFFLRGVAIPVEVNVGDRLGVGFQESPPSGVRVFATIFRVPSGCTWIV
jgi:hypothetical protein